MWERIRITALAIHHNSAPQKSTSHHKSRLKIKNKKRIRDKEWENSRVRELWDRNKKKRIVIPWRALREEERGRRVSENRTGCGGGGLRGLSFFKSRGAPTVAPLASKSPGDCWHEWHVRSQNTVREQRFSMSMSASLQSTCSRVPLQYWRNVTKMLPF